MKKKEETMPIGPQKTKNQIKDTQKSTDEDGPVMLDTEQKQEPEKIEKPQIELQATLYDSDDDLEPIHENDPEYHAKMIQRQFKERIKQYKKKEMKEMTTQDQIEFKDPQSVSEFSQEIYQTLRQ